MSMEISIVSICGGLLLSAMLLALDLIIGERRFWQVFLGIFIGIACLGALHMIIIHRDNYTPPAKESSEFARVLRRFIDNDHYNREQWANILGVKEGDIRDWLSDDDIPSARNLRSLWSVLLEDRRFTNEELEKFYYLMSRPSTGVSPHGNRMLPTIRHYIVGPVLDGFIGTLYTLPPHLQEDILFKAGEMSRDERHGTKYEEPSVEELRYNLFEKHIDELNAKATGMLDEDD